MSQQQDGDSKKSSQAQGVLQQVPSMSCGYIEASHGAHSGLARTNVRRGVKSRHAQMIAIGGIIGTGMFVGSGQALAIAGPATLLIAYIINCFFVYLATTTIITVGAYLPLNGSSMAAYASRYVSESLGFAMGWLYWCFFGLIVANEITAAALVINYWPNAVHIAVWLMILWLVIVALNMLPVRFYAESEFWFASTKVIMIVGLIIFAFVFAVGGGPSGKAIGFRYWHSPGAMKEYLVEGGPGKFCAFLYAVTYSLFSFFGGPEMLVLASGEMKFPRKNLPRASNGVVWRLCIFYVLGILAVGIICPSDAEGLTNGGHGAAASPWTIAMKNAGITALPSIVNAGIVLSAWSAGNSCLYMSSRVLYSMACNGSAPAFFARINRWGTPTNAVLCSSLFGLLSLMSISSSTIKVFNYLVSLINTAGLISWVCSSVICIRFLKACKAQGATNLPHLSIFQPYAAWISLIFFSLMCFLNGIYVFFPGHWSTESFLTSYLGVPIFLSIYVLHRLKHRDRPWAHASHEVDLTTGLDEIIALEEQEAIEQQEQKPNRVRAQVAGACNSISRVYRRCTRK